MVGFGRLSDSEELGGNHSGRWLWFYGVIFFKRIGEASTKLIGIEENDNGQGERINGKLRTKIYGKG